MWRLDEVGADVLALAAKHPNTLKRPQIAWRDRYLKRLDEADRLADYVWRQACAAIPDTPLVAAVDAWEHDAWWAYQRKYRGCGLPLPKACIRAAAEFAAQNPHPLYGTHPTAMDALEEERRATDAARSNWVRAGHTREARRLARLKAIMPALSDAIHN